MRTAITVLFAAFIIAVIFGVEGQKYRQQEAGLSTEIEMKDGGDGTEKYRFTYNNGTVECYYKRPLTKKLIHMNCSGYK